MLKPCVRDARNLMMKVQRGGLIEVQSSIILSEALQLGFGNEDCAVLGVGVKAAKTQAERAPTGHKTTDGTKHVWRNINNAAFHSTTLKFASYNSYS